VAFRETDGISGGRGQVCGHVPGIDHVGVVGNASIAEEGTGPDREAAHRNVVQPPGDGGHRRGKGVPSG